MKTTPDALAALIALIGQRVDLIDTPALVVDLDAMDRNIQRMADFARKHQVRWRPHAKMHKSAELALLLQQAGAQGVCVEGCVRTAVWSACVPLPGLRRSLLSTTTVQR